MDSHDEAYHIPPLKPKASLAAANSATPVAPILPPELPVVAEATDNVSASEVEVAQAQSVEAAPPAEVYRESGGEVGHHEMVTARTETHHEMVVESAATEPAQSLPVEPQSHQIISHHQPESRPALPGRNDTWVPRQPAHHLRWSGSPVSVDLPEPIAQNDGRASGDTNLVLDEVGKEPEGVGATRYGQPQTGVESTGWTETVREPLNPVREHELRLEPTASVGVSVMPEAQMVQPESKVVAPEIPVVEMQPEVAQPQLEALRPQPETEPQTTQPAAAIIQPQPASLPITEPETSKAIVEPPSELKQALGKTRVKTWRSVAIALLSFGLILVAFNWQLLSAQLQYHEPANPNPIAVATPADETVPPQPLLVIPKLNVSVSIVFEDSRDNAAIEKALENGVIHYGGTSLPGQPGNTVIFGHSSNDWWQPGNYKFVFVLLDKLVPGDRFQINYNSKKYVYEVVGSRVVAPTDFSVVAPTADPSVTLITCTPPGTSWQRLAVAAKQISPVTTPTRVATASPVPVTGSLPSNAKSFLGQLGDIWSGIIGFFKAKPASSPSTAPTTTPI